MATAREMRQYGRTLAKIRQDPSSVLGPFNLSNLKARYNVENEGVSVAYVNLVGREYVKFMALKVLAQDFTAIYLSPGPVIDGMWHVHLLDTVDYGEMCGTKMIHHNPNSDTESWPTRYKATTDLYQVVFGEPAPSQCFPLQVEEEDNLIQFMQIFVKSLYGGTFTLHVVPHTTIHRIKEMISHSGDGIPEEQQQLLFGKKELSDEETIMSCNIQPECTLHLIQNLRGC